MPAKLWTPADIATELWCDASDIATITHIGGAVSQIDDKSGNGQHLSQGTGSEQPTTGTRTLNGLNVLDAAGDYLEKSTFAWPSDGDILVIGVMELDASASTWGALLAAKESGGSNIWKYEFAYAGGFYGNVRMSGGYGTTAERKGGPYPGPSVYANFFDRAANSLGAFVDGVSSTIDNTYGSSFPASGGLFRWFRNWDDNVNIDGAMAELIVVNDTSEATRQKIEGYLAWKWGLQANLPATHPYKWGAPTTVV